jgi:hypothetical protein
VSFTVTSTVSGGASDGSLFTLNVTVLTGVATVQNGVTVTTSAAAGALSPPQKAITPGATGSYVYGAIVTWSGGGAGYTVNASTTLDASGFSGNTDYSTFRSTAKTTASTPVTLGSTAPTGATFGTLAMAEILASGTLAEDASTPAGVTGTGTSQTTAAFTPPAGALLVAASAGSGPSATAYVITITDTSGLGMTWTQLAMGNTSGNDVAGVWATVVPGLSTAGGSYQTFTG